MWLCDFEQRNQATLTTTLSVAIQHEPICLQHPPVDCKVCQLQCCLCWCKCPSWCDFHRWTIPTRVVRVTGIRLWRSPNSASSLSLTASTVLRLQTLFGALVCCWHTSPKTLNLWDDKIFCYIFQKQYKIKASLNMHTEFLALVTRTVLNILINNLIYNLARTTQGGVRTKTNSTRHSQTRAGMTTEHQ